MLFLIIMIIILMTIFLDDYDLTLYDFIQKSTFLTACNLDFGY